ncbi:hypothetical protein JCM14244_05400 [Venenivibrio stagnispumantis]|nr:hypothetical protein [Venenivibrio stagnispumantis]
MKIHKTLLLKIYEPNKAKREYLDNIISIYAKTLNFYLDAIKNLGMFYIASLDNKQALTYLYQNRYEIILINLMYEKDNTGN